MASQASALGFSFGALSDADKSQMASEEEVRQLVSQLEAKIEDPQACAHLSRVLTDVAEYSPAVLKYFISPNKVNQALTLHGEQSEVLVKLLNLTTIMTSDEDLRKEFWQSSDLLQTTLKSMKTEASDAVLFAALRCLLVQLKDVETQTVVRENAGIVAVLDAMEAHIEDVRLTKVCSEIVAVLAGNSDNHLSIGDEGGLDNIVGALKQHSSEHEVVRLSFESLSKLAEDKEICAMLAEEDSGMVSILEVAGELTTDVPLVIQVLQFLTNAGRSEFRLRCIEAGAAHFIATVMALPGSTEEVLTACSKILSEWSSDPQVVFALFEEEVPQAIFKGIQNNVAHTEVVRCSFQVLIRLCDNPDEAEPQEAAEALVELGLFTVCAAVLEQQKTPRTIEVVFDMLKFVVPSSENPSSGLLKQVQSVLQEQDDAKTARQGLEIIAQLLTQESASAFNVACHVALLKKHAEDKTVQEITLCNLARFCSLEPQKGADEGALECIIDVLSHSQSLEVLEEIFMAVEKTFSVADIAGTVTRTFATTLPVFLGDKQAGPKYPSLVPLCLRASAALSGSSANVQRFMENNLHLTVIQFFCQNSTEPKFATECCKILANVATTEDLYRKEICKHSPFPVFLADEMKAGTLPKETIPYGLALVGNLCLDGECCAEWMDTLDFALTDLTASGPPTSAMLGYAAAAVVVSGSDAQVSQLTKKPNLVSLITAAAASVTDGEGPSLGREDRQICVKALQKLGKPIPELPEEKEEAPAETEAKAPTKTESTSEDYADDAEEPEPEDAEEPEDDFEADFEDDDKADEPSSEDGGARSEEISALKKEVERQKAELDEWQAKLNELQTELDGRKETMDEKEEEMVQREEEVQRAQKESEKKSNQEEWQKELEERENVIEERESTLKAKEDAEGALEKRIEAVAKQEKALEEANADQAKRLTTVEEKEKKLDQREAKEGRIRDRERNLENKEKIYHDRDQTLIAKEQDVSERESAIGRREKKAKDGLAEIDERDKGMIERETNVQNSLKDLAVREEEAAKLKAECEELRVKLQEQIKSLDKREMEVQIAEQTFAEKQEELNQLKESITTRDTAIIEREKALEETEGRLATQEKESIKKNKASEDALASSKAKESKALQIEKQLAEKQAALVAQQKEHDAEVAQCDEQKAQNDKVLRQIQALEKKVEEQQQDIEWREKSISHREREGELKEQNIARRDSEMKKKEKAFGDREKELEDRTKLIAQREKEFNINLKDLERREVTTRDRVKTCQQREEEVNKQLQDVSKREKEVQARAEAVAESEKDVVAREEDMTRREEELSAQSEEVATRKQDVEAREQSMTSKEKAHKQDTRDLREATKQIEKRERELVDWMKEMEWREYDFLEREEHNDKSGLCIPKTKSNSKFNEAILSVQLGRIKETYITAKERMLRDRQRNLPELKKNTEFVSAIKDFSGLKDMSMEVKRKAREFRTIMARLRGFKVDEDVPADVRELQEAYTSHEREELRNALLRERELAEEGVFMVEMMTCPMNERHKFISDSEMVFALEEWWADARGFVHDRQKKLLKDRLALLDESIRVLTNRSDQSPNVFVKRQLDFVSPTAKKQGGLLFSSTYPAGSTKLKPLPDPWKRSYVNSTPSPYGKALVSPLSKTKRGTKVKKRSKADESKDATKPNPDEDAHLPADAALATEPRSASAASRLEVPEDDHPRPNSSNSNSPTSPASPISAGEGEDEKSAHDSEDETSNDRSPQSGSGSDDESDKEDSDSEKDDDDASDDASDSDDDSEEDSS